MDKVREDMANLFIVKEKHLPSEYNSDVDDPEAPPKEDEDSGPVQRDPWFGRKQTFEEAQQVSLEKSLQKAWDLTEKEGYQSEELIPQDPELEAFQKAQEKLDQKNPPLTDQEKHIVEEVIKEQQKIDSEQKKSFGKALADRIEIVQSQSTKNLVNDQQNDDSQIFEVMPDEPEKMPYPDESKFMPKPSPQDDFQYYPRDKDLRWNQQTARIQRIQKEEADNDEMVDAFEKMLNKQLANPEKKLTYDDIKDKKGQIPNHMFDKVDVKMIDPVEIEDKSYFDTSNKKYATGAKKKEKKIPLKAKIRRAQKDLELCQSAQKVLLRGGKVTKPALNMGMPRLYHHDLDFASAQARYALSAGQIDFQEMIVDLENTAPWHKQLNNGKIPILELKEGSYVIGGSEIIKWALQNGRKDKLEYCQLIPEDEEMAQGMNAKIENFRTKLLKPLKALFASRGNNPQLIQQFKYKELPQHELIAPVSTHFLWGDDITIVDIMIGPFWEYLFLFKEGPMELIYAELDIPQSAPRLYAYIQKFRNHPAIEKTKMLQKVSNCYWRRATAITKDRLCPFSTKEYSTLGAARFETVGEYMEQVAERTKDKLKNWISANKMVIVTKSYYFSAKQTLKVIEANKISAKIIELDKIEDEHEVEDEMQKITGKNQIPSIFIGGEFFGGNAELQSAMKNGEMFNILKKNGIDFDQGK